MGVWTRRNSGECSLSTTECVIVVVYVIRSSLRVAREHGIRLLSHVSVQSQQLTLAPCRPICPQIRNRWLESRLYGLPREVIPAYKPLHEPPQNELDCLNLTITVPSPAARARCDALTASLPVMVWVHGGGNVTGAGTDWIWDAGALVRKSVESGMPVIVVAIK